ncbi:unnamed protein product [Symbiodinium sp. CCMP2592]|nr:unnamed protein product [Symbiodinium sp. CCMP2592]
MHAGTLPASATARALPLLPAFSASAAPAASAPALLPTDLSSCPLTLRGDPEGARALFGSGPDDRGPPTSDPASFRPPRPDSYGPVAGRGGAPLPDVPMSEHPDAPHASVATIDAADPGGAAPATDNGGRLTGPCAVRALVDEAIGSDASARIAADILAIAQGVTNTQADLDILRNGVSDVTEVLENKIRDMWELLQGALRDEHQLLTHVQDSIREKRISDLESLDERFERLNSMINDRFIEFDERIHQFNEKRAGSLSMQLAETNCHIRQYPDALRQIQINISNAEARIAAVEQHATHRIEVIRSEMSRALYDHKESNRTLIDQLTARVQYLESAHVRRQGSDKSTPSRRERTQFFDISDHDGEIPRPADLPPVPGALFPGELSKESLTNILAKVVGKIILWSLFDKIMAKRQPLFREDRRIRPFLPQMPLDRHRFRLDPEPEPAQLRRWIVDMKEMKERVANAFAYDPGYALSWVEIPDGTRYEDLLEECKYGMLENECNSAFRECVKSIALKNKIQTETERMHTINRQRDEVVLGDGEEYAVPAPGDDGLIDVEVGFDDDGFLERIDDGGDDQSGSFQGAEVDQRLPSYQRPSKFSPTSKPGIFLGYHFENGGKWDGDYIVADLEDFKRDATRASVHQVKKVYCSPKERWTFPMLAVYDKQTRSVCINDPAMQSTVPKPSERLDASDMLELEDIDEIFALDDSTRMTDEDIQRAREAELRVESSHGGGVDYWEHDPSTHKWTYHVVVPRKAMVHPSKTPGSIGESPDPWKLSTVRISHVQYKDKLMQLWTGTVEFFDDGFAPPKKKLPPYHGSEILSWRSMNRAEREGYVEAERREAESHAMSREDSRDAAPVDIAFDSDYESSAERHDKDYWYHDVAAGTVTRFHVIERPARFNPTSVKDCPVDPATLTDVRVTMAMTDGTEFTIQDAWRAHDTRSLPCRWTGKTIFVIGSSAKTQVKVRTTMPSKDGTERRVQTANGYYGHVLRAKVRTTIPAKSRACVVTDLEFDPPSGMSARVQPLRGSGLEKSPAMCTYNEGATQSGVDVINPTDSDILIESGQDVAVVQFYTSVLAAVELDFTAEDEAGTSAPAEPSDIGLTADSVPAMPTRSESRSSVFFYSACVARPVDRKGWELMASKIKLEPPSSIKSYLGCEHEPKKAFPELTFGDRNTSVAQGSTGPREIRMIKYDMRSFMEQCVSRYVELCGPKYKATLRSADTPFLDESRPEFDVNPDRPAVNRLLGHPTDTPVPPGKGVLGDCAAAVLMKILYGARMGRYNLIRPVQALASLITKWDGLCDTKLHRLVCYINSTLDLNLYGWIGDAPEMLELVLYCDADLAGDRTDSKSTSGVFMCLLGPRSFMPLNALSKKQTSVSKSTPEAEIVSLDHAVYKLGLAALSMWEYMLGRRFRLRVMEDNEAAIRVIITGHNPNMRHMSRTQRIDISALNERYHAGDFLFVTCPSQFEAGDILTKACTDAKVMTALAFSRVAVLSGDAAGAREKMGLVISLVRHCMHFQAQSMKGSREMLSYDTLRLMGDRYIPSPLASWNRNLIGYSSKSAEQRWLRTDTSLSHNDVAGFNASELVRDAVNQAEAVKFFKGFLQLRPTLTFLPGSFLAIKALNRFPTLASLEEQAMHLENDRREHGYDLPAVDANGIGEVAAFRDEGNDDNTPLMRGWASYMKTYPGRCVSIHDTLNWGASTGMTYEDGAGQTVIHPTDGWTYVPAMNSDIYNPQDTVLHGTNLRYLWSILAHGGLFGEDYVTDYKLNALMPLNGFIEMNGLMAVSFRSHGFIPKVLCS